VKPAISSSAALILLACGAGDALGQGACPPRLIGAQLVTTLSGKYVCARRPGTSIADSWNELHQGTTAAGGPIMVYKRGPSDPVDPSKVVGRYSIDTSASTVTYHYLDAGGPYTYAVRGLPSPNLPAPGSSSATSPPVK
jgi:hypothetical protein